VEKTISRALCIHELTEKDIEDLKENREEYVIKTSENTGTIFIKIGLHLSLGGITIYSNIIEYLEDRSKKAALEA
jgi:hypothetical protein